MLMQTFGLGRIHYRLCDFCLLCLLGTGDPGGKAASGGASQPQEGCTRRSRLWRRFAHQVDRLKFLLESSRSLNGGFSCSAMHAEYHCSHTRAAVATGTRYMRSKNALLVDLIVQPSAR